MFPAQAKADDKFWFSNRIELGYDKLFLRESFTVRDNQITRNRISLGVNFKLSEKIVSPGWQADHQLGAQLNFKLQ